MVRLERLVMQGFKSFKRKVSIPFPQGFSVVTGPNGSGKSNVGDGIAFVLGEKSSRSMRAKKAQDLIFHGSEKKEGSDFAFVALYFDNTKKDLPFEDPSVSVSRKLNKNGVSTYRLNGKVVTRQQVVDVLSQCQISPDGHNIIQQGDVTQIVEMDPVQRRQILDEISGILEFDEKKQKAMKELEKIGVKVKEAEIILNEKTAIMAKLSSEREAALKYRTLQAQLEQLRAAVLWKEYTESNTGLADMNTQLSQKTAEFQKLETDIPVLEAQVEESEKKFAELTKEIVRASTSIDQTKKAAQLRAEIDANRRLLQSNQTETSRLDGLISRLASLDKRSSPAVKAALQLPGAHGMLADLLQIPQKYAVAVDIALGGKSSDIVVDTQEQAVKAIETLKAQKIGRARFLPLDKIHIPDKRSLPKGSPGWLSDLVSSKPRFLPAVQYALGTTAVAPDIQSAKSMFNTQRTRIVTLDGDLLEVSGTLTGGFTSHRSSVASELNQYKEARVQLEEESDILSSRIEEAEKQLSKIASPETDFSRLDRDRASLDQQLTARRLARQEAYQARLTLQAEIGRLNIKKARFEARFDDVKLQWQSLNQKLAMEKPDLGPYEKLEIPSLRSKERETVIAIEALGPINMKAVDDYELLKGEFDEFREKVEAIVSEKNAIEATVLKIEEKRKATFMQTLVGVNAHFADVYRELTGGQAELALENDSLEGGLFIRASPPGKKLLNLDSMSGGEKTLTAFGFLFALQRHQPTPFYVLDEADAALDKQNTARVAKLIHKQSGSAQFIIISHNDSLIKEADRVYGVSMEDGESKVIGVELPPEQDIKEQQMIAAE